MLTLRPASLLWRFIKSRAFSIEAFSQVFSRSRASTNSLLKRYPQLRLSPQPPQSQSRGRSLGRAALLQPQLDNSPSLHARLTAFTTPAALIAYVNAASRLPVKTSTKNKHQRRNLRLPSKQCMHTTLAVMLNMRHLFLKFINYNKNHREFVFKSQFYNHTIYLQLQLVVLIPISHYRHVLHIFLNIYCNFNFIHCYR